MLLRDIRCAILETSVIEAREIEVFLFKAAKQIHGEYKACGSRYGDQVLDV